MLSHLIVQIDYRITHFKYAEQKRGLVSKICIDTKSMHSTQGDRPKEIKIAIHRLRSVRFFAFIRLPLEARTTLPTSIRYARCLPSLLTTHQLCLWGLMDSSAMPMWTSSRTLSERNALYLQKYTKHKTASQIAQQHIYTEWFFVQWGMRFNSCSKRNFCLDIKWYRRYAMYRVSICSPRFDTSCCMSLSITIWAH